MKAMFKIVAASVGVLAATFTASAAISGATGEIVPGEWNCDYNKGKAYADANHIPLVVFYGKADCGNCRSLKSHLDSEEAKAWYAEKGYVLVLSTKYSSPGWEAARQLCLDAYNSTKLPMIGVYWAKEDGATILKGFTGTSSGMSGTGGMDTKFIYTVESILGTQGSSSSGGGSSTEGGSSTGGESETGTIPALFSKANKLTGVVLNEDGELEGVITVKTGKANTRKKTVTVKATVQLIGMTKKSFRTVKFDATTTETYKLTGTLGTLAIKFVGGTFSGTLDSNVGEYTVEGATVGGALPSSTGYVTLLGTIPTYMNYPVFTDWLPANQTFTAAGTRWTFPKAGKAKYDRTSQAFVNTAETTNPSGMKLTYKSSTGYFKGGFYVCYKMSDTKVARKKMKVVGYVYDGTGYGVATITGQGTLDVTITTTPYVEESEESGEDGE